MNQAIAIILAAGASQRMGTTKALLTIGANDDTFLKTIVNAFTEAGCQTLVVVGKDADAIRARHPELRLIENPDWASGQFSSAKVGMKASLHSGAQIVLLHPVDTPLVSSRTVDALIAGIGSNDGVVPQYENVLGHPLVLTRQSTEKILAMDDAPHMEAAQARLTIARIPTNDSAVVLNLNTLEAYQRWLATKR